MHELSAFDGAKRTCMAKLQEHNDSRRRTRAAQASADDSPPEGSPPRAQRRRTPSEKLRGGSSSDTASPESSAPPEPAFRLAPDDSALLVFDAAAFAKDTFDLEALLAADVPLFDEPRPAAAWGPPPSPTLPYATLASVASAMPQAFTAHLKLPHAAAPVPFDAADALGSQLLHAFWLGHATAMGSCVRPGCVLITLDALLAPEGAARLAAAADGDGAALALAALLALPTPAGAYLRQQREVTLRLGDGEATGAGVSRHAAALRAPPLAALALLSTQEAQLALTQPPHGALACRLGAAVLPCAMSGDSILLPACGFEGTLLVEAVPEGTPLHRAGAPRPVLLTRDAAIAAEVDACLAPAADRDAAERIVHVLGAALAPGAGAELLAAAAAGGARLGLPATLARLSTALRERCESDGAPFAPHFLRLLLAAAAAPRPDAALAALVGAHTHVASGARLAAQLLRAAASDGHVFMACAIAEAQDALAAMRPPPQADLASAAVAFLAAMAAADDADDGEIRPQQEDVVYAAAEACAAAASADDAEREAGYVHYLFKIALPAWRTVGLLTVLVHTAHLLLWIFCIRSEPSPAKLLARGAVLRKQVRDTLLYDPADLSAPPLTMLDYPWAAVVAAAPPYVAWTLLLHLPTHAAILLFCCSRRLRSFASSHYEPIFHVLSTLEVVTYLVMDACIYRTTGRVPLYPITGCFLHSLGVVIFHRRGPFRRTLSNWQLVCRLVCTFAVTVCTGAFGLLLKPHNVIQILALLLTWALSGRNDRYLRARYADEVARQRATKQKLA